MNHYTITTKLGSFQVQMNDEKLSSLKRVQKKSSSHQLPPLVKKLKLWLDDYASGKRPPAFPLKDCDLSQGSPFQQKVWKALYQIPMGECRSYTDIAKKVKSPKACRAVGQANHVNPLSIIIPCHRVIRSNGDLGGYASGLAMKKRLLSLEKKA